MKMLIKTKLSEHKVKTPEGYLICSDAILARTGKQQYLKSEIYPGSADDEIIEIDRPENEVFSDATMASFENKPLTCEHPFENVNPENYRDLAVGYVRDIHRGTYDGQPVMLGNLVVTDQSIIEDIENGYRTELSCGYDCDITDGPNPKQINIRGNHVALCEQGRAGIAKIIDKKTVKDTISNGTLIQEYGKQADQYKVFKVEGNTIYTRELKSGCVFLFKKDKQGLDWDIITKSDVRDSKQVNDEFELVAGMQFKDLNNDIWQLTEIDNDNLTFMINNKENILNKETFLKMIGKEVRPVTEIQDVTILDNTKYVVIVYNGKPAAIAKENFDKNEVSKANLIICENCKDVEDMIEYLMDEKGISRENIIDGTKSVKDIKVLDSTNYPKVADKFRECVIYEQEDGSYTSQYLDEEFKSETIEEMKDILKKAILNNIKKYSKKFELKEFKDSHSQMFYKKMNEQIEKNINTLSENPIDDSEEDEVREAYNQQRANTIEDLLGQLKAYKEKLKK